MSEEPTPSQPSSSESGGALELIAPVSEHLRRAWTWDVGAIEPLPAERTLLAPGAGDSLLRYLLWRRANVLVALGAGLIGLIFGLISTIKNIDGLDQLPQGEELIGLLYVAGFAARVFLVVMLWKAVTAWTDANSTKSALRRGWLVSLLAPLAICVVPILAIAMGELTIQDRVRLGAQGLLTRNLQMDVLGLVFGLYFFWLAVPALLSLFPGILRSGAVVKTLFPGRGVSMATASALSPVYAIFLIVILVPVQQLAGSWVFFAGMALVASGPLVYGRAVLRLLAPMDAEEAGRRVTAARARMRWFMVPGILLLIAPLLDRTVFGISVIGWDDAMFDIWSVLGLLSWFVTMICTYSIVSADSMIGVMHEVDQRGAENRKTALWKADVAPLDEISDQLGPLEVVSRALDPASTDTAETTDEEAGS